MNSFQRDTSLLTAAAATGLAVSSVAVLQVFTKADPIGRCYTFWKQLGSQVRTRNARCSLTTLKKERRLSSSDTVDSGIDAYSKLHHEADTETRLNSYKQLVNGGKSL